MKSILSLFEQIIQFVQQASKLVLIIGLLIISKLFSQLSILIINTLCNLDGFGPTAAVRRPADSQTGIT